MALAAAGDGSPRKGEPTSGKKGSLSVDLKGLTPKGASLDKEEEKTEAGENLLLSGLAVMPLVPVVKAGEAFPAAGFTEGVEKSAAASKGQGATPPSLKGGMTFQMGGAPVTGPQPDGPDEMGVDRFASMMRGAVEGKKTTGMKTDLASPAGTVLASSESRPVDVLAGAASGFGMKTGRPGSRPKTDGGKEISPADAALVDSKTAKGSRKEPSLMAGNGFRSRVPQAEEPVPTAPRILQPVAVDRAGVPVQPLTAEAMAALSELEPSAATDTPKSGLTRQLALQVGRQISTSLKKNDHEVTFQVRPPSLGRLQIRIEKEGERVLVRIVSEKEKTGEILAAGKHDLRVLMADHGIRLDRIEVTTGSAMDFMAQDGGSTEGRGGRGRSSPRQGGEGRSGEADSEVARPAKKEHDGAINVMV